MSGNQLNHILLLPDGNRRYAEQEGIPLDKLYKDQSDEVTTNIIKFLLIEKKIPELSIWGISKSNVLQRTESDMQAIYDAQIHAYEIWLKDEEMKQAGIRFKFIGDAELLPGEYRRVMKRLEEATAKYTGPRCNLLVAYSAQWEVVEAYKKAQAANEIITEDTLNDFLELKTPIDMVIRSGFEKRLSECPVLQTVFAEIFFLDLYYPDLTNEVINGVLEEFGNRKRRFGK
ncbi:MAG: undecaprenyl diphosphate synthase family protein [bacterium]|nr:undecaprenyl diphosphate synthase family protein [bacterium]